MNHIYRSIWNATLGCWVAAPETARLHGQGRQRRARTGSQHRWLALVQPLALACALAWAGLGYAANPLPSQIGTDGANSWDGASSGTDASYEADSAMTADVPTKVGGNGGTSNGMNQSGGRGGHGTLTVESGGSVTLTGSSISLGGNGSLGNGVNSHGGSGGNGTLTVESGGSVTLTDSSMVLGGNGSYGNGPNSTGGSGGNGTLNLSGALLASGNSSMTIKANGQLSLGSASAGAASAGSITGLVSITNNGLIQFNQSDSSYTFGTAITGTGRVVHNVVGTTVLIGTNTYSGDTTIEAGTLALGAGATLSSTGSLNLRSATAVFDTSAGGSHTIGGLVGVAGSQVLLGSSALTLGSATSTDFSGAISGNGGSLIKQGGGTLTLKGANTYTGGTTINNGTLALAGPDASLTNSTAVSVGAAGTFDISGADGQTVGSLAGAGSVRLGADNLTVGGNNSSTTFSGVISGAGGLSKVGTGTLTLSGANVYVGSTSVSAGTLMLGSADALSTNVVNVANGATLDANTAVQLANRVNFFHTGSGVGGTADLTLNGAVGFYGNTVKKGAANLTLNGTNIQSGGISLESGTLTVGNNSALGTGDLTVQGGSNLDSSVGVTLSNKVILNDDPTVLGSHALGLDGVISGTGGLTKDGNATLTVTGNNSYSGGSIINSGTLAIGAGGSLAATGAVHLGGLGTLDISAAGGNQTIGALSGVSGSAVKLGSNTLTFGTASNQTFDGNISGGGGLTKNGAANLTLNGSNVFLGGITLNAGTLTVGNSIAVGTGELTVAGASTLDSNSAVTLGNDVVLNAILTNAGSNDLTLGGTISGGGQLVKNGASNLTLTGFNSYMRGTTLNAGTLTVGASGALGHGALTVAGASTLDNIMPLVLANDINVNANLSVAGNNNLILGGVIAGAGTLTKNGMSDLTLSGSNTFTGTFDLQQGSLTTLSTTALGSNAAVNLGAATTLNLGASASIGSLTGSGTATLGGGDTLSIGGNNSSSVFAGILSGNGDLTKLGSGTLTLSGLNNLTGDTHVNAGSLLVNGTLDSVNVLINSGGKLGGSGTLSGAVTVADGGHLEGATGSTLNVGSLVLGANSNFDVALGAPVVGGGTEIVSVAGDLTLGGSLNVRDVGGFGTGVYRLINYTGGLTNNNMLIGNVPSGVVQGNLQLQTALANQVNLVYSSPDVAVQFWDGSQLSGNGTVQGGSGTWSAGATNWTESNGNFNQAWVKNFAVFGGTAGTVSVDGAQTISGMQFMTDGYTLQDGNSGALNLVNGSTGKAIVRVDRDVTATLDVAVNGTATLAKEDAGTLVLNAANGYTGGTALNGGKIIVGNNDALGTGTLTAAGGTFLESNKTVNLDNDVTLNGALTVVGSHDLTLAGVVTGNGSLTKNGSATLTLSGANDYAGGTTINSGRLTASAGSLGNGAIVNNKTLELMQSVDGTLSQTVSGRGELTKSGTGTLTLTGNNTYEGGTTILDGKLIASASSLGSALIVNEAALELNQAVNGILANDITGNGSLTKTGAGGLLLTGTNTSTGTTTISDGFLVVSAGSLSGGAITNNAQLVINQATDASLSQAISGSGDLAKSGAGVLTLTGANTSTGGTTIVEGTLVASAGNLGSGAIVNNAALVLNQATDASLSQDISGNGNLIKSGAGVLTLTGANTSIGGTTISAGKLVASVGNLGLGTIANNAALELNQTVDRTLTQAITGSGNLTKTGTGTLTLAGSNTYEGGTTISAGKLVASVGSLGSGAIANNAALELNQATDASLAQALSGNGSLTKTGAGALTLTGNGSNFAGTTRVDAGSLLLSSTGKLGGNLTVASGAKLAGSGTVGGAGTVTTVQSGATLAAGDAGSPFGTLRVLGDLTLESGSSFLVQANPDSSESSLVKVAGAATLNGSVLHVGTESNAQTDFQVGKTYTILSASQINGTFETATSNFAYLDAKLDYTTANQVDLELQRKRGVSFASLSDTTNQGSAANALESLPKTHALYQFVEKLPAGAPAQVFSSLSGDAHATMTGTVNMLSAHAPNISQQHLRNNLTSGFRPGAPIAQSDGPLPASALPSSKALPAWVEVVGHWQKMDGNSNAPGVKQNTTGLFLGADEEVGNSGWRVGGSVGYTSADAKVNSRDASADISSYSAAVYTGKGFSHAGNRVNVIGGLAYTKHSIESERSVASLGQNLKADYSAHTAQLFAEVGYAMGQYDKQGFEPFVGITLGEQRSDSFKESGGFAALSSESSRDTLASTTLGVRAHSDLKLAGKNTRVRGSLGVRHAWGNLSQNRTMAFEGSSSFTVAGAPLARNTALVGLQAEMELSRNAALVLGYTGEYGSGSRDQSASVKVRWAF